MNGGFSKDVQASVSDHKRHKRRLVTAMIIDTVILALTGICMAVYVMATMHAFYCREEPR
jgi:sugar phosphate permease